MSETAIESAADDIATRIIAIMVNSFSDRHGRQPSSDEVQSMLEELTEDRITELMGQKTVSCPNGSHTAITGEEDRESATEDDISSESDDEGHLHYSGGTSNA